MRLTTFFSVFGLQVFGWSWRNLNSTMTLTKCGFFNPRQTLLKLFAISICSYLSSITLVNKLRLLILFVSQFDVHVKLVLLNTLTGTCTTGGSLKFFHLPPHVPPVLQPSSTVSHTSQMRFLVTPRVCYGAKLSAVTEVKR